jgi:hypothetical protein
LEKILAALAAIGGFTAVGSFFDLMILKRGKQKLLSTIEDWWIRFDDVKWGNFGRKESDEALASLNKWAGASFISKKRIQFVAIVGAVCALLALLWEILAALIGYLYESGPTSAIIYVENYWRGVFTPSWAALATTALASLLLFSASVSLMQWLTRVVRDLNPVGVVGLLFFAMLLFLHCLLFLYWSVPIKTVLVTLPYYLSASAHFNSGVTQEALTALFNFKDVSIDPAARLSDIAQQFKLPRRPLAGGWQDVDLIFSGFLNVFVNGLRIGFTLLFFISFAFGSVLKPLISRLLEGVIESGKPIFSMIFGFTGAVFQLINVALK